MINKIFQGRSHNNIFLLIQSLPSDCSLLVPHCVRDIFITLLSLPCCCSDDYLLKYVRKACNNFSGAFFYSISTKFITFPKHILYFSGSRLAKTCVEHSSWSNIMECFPIYFSFKTTGIKRYVFMHDNMTSCVVKLDKPYALNQNQSVKNSTPDRKKLNK